MEAYNELVRRLAKCLEKTDFAFTGALAVSFYGSPRTTSDVDLLVAVGRNADMKRKLIGVLECAGMEVEELQIDRALSSGYKVARFRDKVTPYLVDVIFEEAIEKRPGKVAGTTAFLQKPEGLIVAKLRMIKATIPRERAAKDEEDVRAVLAFTKVDLGAVKRQAKKDKTLEILESLIE